MPTVYRPQVLADLRGLRLDLRQRALAAMRSIERRPEPDGFTRRELPIPFRPGTLGASIDGFAIRYVITETGVEFVRVQLVPNLTDW